jgi:hypothetical protein
MLYVPVVDSNQKPLMPTTAIRAAKWIASKKATPFWKRGIFCVRLNVEPSSRNTQTIALGIDPGSKKEGYTAKSDSHTYLNIQADAVTWVKDAVETRRNLRRSRRNRKTPYRKCRWNRSTKANYDDFKLAPSTHARWDWKLRIVKWLSKLYPISCFIVEDIKARTKKYKDAYSAFGQKTGAAQKFNGNFSVLEQGKKWFYEQLSKLGRLETKEGWETAELRKAHGLEKSKNKMAEVFEAHCVDSWVLANWFVGGHIKPDYKRMLCITPLRFHRRQLHVQNPTEGNIRKPYGGTRSAGFTRGSLVEHSKKGLAYVGGTSNGRISLHDVATGKRLGQSYKPEDCKFLSFNTWRTRLLPPQRGGFPSLKSR